MTEENYTSIQISKETRDRLNALCYLWDTSQDKVINRLIQMADMEDELEKIQKIKKSG